MVNKKVRNYLRKNFGVTEVDIDLPRWIGNEWTVNIRNIDGITGNNSYVVLDDKTEKIIIPKSYPNVS